MPIIPEISIINFAKVSNFGKVCTAKAMCWDWLEDSEENGDSQKDELR